MALSVVRLTRSGRCCRTRRCSVGHRVVMCLRFECLIADTRRSDRYRDLWRSYEPSRALGATTIRASAEAALCFVAQVAESERAYRDLPRAAIPGTAELRGRRRPVLVGGDVVGGWFGLVDKRMAAQGARSCRRA